LPWSELCYDVVVIVLTKPVLDEIDKHKKATGRTRSRALEIFARFRAMLTSGVAEVEIRPSSPRVVLRRMATTLPDPDLKEHLDYGKPDERLIGIVSTLNAQATGYDVKLFTDDGGPAGTAADLGVPFLMIDTNWRRPPAESTEGKRIKELEKDLAMYRAAEPKIGIRCETADEDNVVEVVRKIAEPLSEGEIDEIVEALRRKHPMKADFTPPPTSTTTETFGDVVTVEYSAPLDDDIADYRDVRYPKWIENCRGVLRSLHIGRDEIEPEVSLRWSMSNDGTRPASQVRVEFAAQGPLELLRRRPKKEDDDEKADEAPARASAPSTPRFQPAPKPPAFGRQVTRKPAPVPARPKLPGGFDIAALRSSALLDEKWVKSALDATKFTGIPRLDHIPEYMKQVHSASDVLKRWHDPNLLAASRFDSLVTPQSFATVTPRSFDSLSIARSLVPDPHDPERFYYDWPRGRPVKKGALTCDLWRHQMEDEIFEFEVLFTKENEARGAVECTVHADNLTKPEQAKVIVGRVLEPLSMVDLAKSMVETSE
jgi:hypothetical protein